METTRQFLARRERELAQEVAQMHAQLGPKEVELAEVRRAKSAIDKSGLGASVGSGLLGLGLPDLGASPNLEFGGLLAGALDDLRENPGRRTEGPRPAVRLPKAPEKSTVDPKDFDVASPYQHYTMKELTVKALAEHFPHGATAKQLLQFFAGAWDRNIKRENLSPQLSRLVQTGVLTREGRVWSLASSNKAPTDSSESAS